MADRPRTLGDSAAASARRARVNEPHVKPLNDLVQGMIAEGRPAPLVDPDSGGVNARVLFLLESPGPKSSTDHGSGVISIDNDDPTAERCWRLIREAGLDPTLCVNWNAVPWYVSSDRKNKNATLADWRESADWFDQFLRRLPHLRVVVPMGRFARDCWRRYLLQPGARTLQSFPCPHPSNLARVSNPDFERDIVQAMLLAKEYRFEYETGRFADVDPEQVDAVTDVRGFINVIETMRADLLRSPGAWENSTLERFLESLAASADGMASLDSNRGKEFPKPPDWRQLAELLVMASGYE